MASSSQRKKDHWDAETYNSAAGYVPKLTSTVVSYLDAQPTDRILDIGCGDGSLTAQIARSAKSVLGVDASNNFITSAKEKYGGVNNCEFLLHDATDLGTCEQVVKGEWDKVFSNAAMHWILRKEATRKDFLKNIWTALKSGGTFVFEMGGKGNAAEIHAACMSALVHAGLSIEDAKEASPWFFPSMNWTREALEEADFEVLKVETEYRPSKLEPGALESWIRLMCADFLDALGDGEAKRERAVQKDLQCRRDSGDEGRGWKSVSGQPPTERCGEEEIDRSQVNQQCSGRGGCLVVMSSISRSRNR